MKLQFDAKQEFQIAAVDSVVDLFDGQPLNKGDFQISFEAKGQGLFGSLVQSVLSASVRRPENLENRGGQASSSSCS